MWNIILSLLSDPIHLYLLSGDVLATIAVGFGIVWEHGPPEVQKVANKLVIGGVIVETVCSILLFAYDENTSAEQKSIIEAQRAQIIGLEKETAPRILDKDNQAKLAAVLKKFSPRNIVVTTYMLDLEAAWLASEIMNAVKDGGMTPVNAIGHMGSTSIFEVGVSVSNAPDEQELGIGIAATLAMLGIAARHLAVLHTSDVTIFVAVKPIPGRSIGKFAP